MHTLLSGLVCLIHSFQQQIQIDLQISPDLIRIIWFDQTIEEVNDFKTFYFNNDSEKIRSIQSAIYFATECLLKDLLSQQKKEAA